MPRLALVSVMGFVTACGSAASTTTDAGPDAAGSDARVSCIGPMACIQVDASRPGHTISPLLFGDQIGWLDDGQGFWDPVANGLRTPWITALRPIGLTLLRYPGGTLSDFFHWQGAVGPVAARVPQESPFAAQPGTTQIPLFGPDEFAQVARMLGTEMLITANVGDGSAQEAASWLSHYKAMGITPRYWEIGNEVYLTGTGWAAVKQRKTPAQYAGLFDAYAAALRAVDPSVKIGMLGCHDTGTFPLCTDPSWNRTVLSSATQSADFFVVHNSYAPAAPYSADFASAMRATVAAPDYVAANFAAVEAELSAYGRGANAGLPIAVTEHASFFVPSRQATDAQWLSLNRTLGAAVFSATEYDVFMSDPRIQIVNHINPVEAYWQAHLTTSAADKVSSPTVSAFGLVFRLYADAAGGTFVPAAIQGSPTFDAPSFGIVPALTGVSVLHGVAVVAPTGDRLFLYVVNRDLARDVAAEVVVNGYPAGGVTSVKAELVNGPSWQSLNQAGGPSDVTLTASVLPPSNALTVTFPAHSLTRLTVR